MATRYSGDYTVTCTYLDRGDYKCTVTPQGRRGKTVYVGPPAAGFGRGVTYDSPQAYDEVAKTAISFAEDEGLDGNAEYDEKLSGQVVHRSQPTYWKKGPPRQRRPTTEVAAEKETKEARKREKQEREYAEREAKEGTLVVRTSDGQERRFWEMRDSTPGRVGAIDWAFDVVKRLGPGARAEITRVGKTWPHTAIQANEHGVPSFVSINQLGEERTGGRTGGSGARATGSNRPRAHCYHAKGGGGSCVLTRFETEVLKDLRRPTTERVVPYTPLYDKARRSLHDHDLAAWHRHEPGVQSLHDYLVLTPDGVAALAACSVPSRPAGQRGGGGAAAKRGKHQDVKRQAILAGWNELDAILSGINGDTWRAILRARHIGHDERVVAYLRRMDPRTFQKWSDDELAEYLVARDLRSNFPSADER